MYSVLITSKLDITNKKKGDFLMEFLMAMGYLFIMFPLLSLAIILFLLIAFSLTIVFSMLLGSFYFVSLFLKNIEIDLFSLMLYFTLFLFQTSLLSFLIAILSFIIKAKKYLNCLFLVISTMLLAFVYPVAIFVCVLLDFAIRKLMLKHNPEDIKKMFFY